MHAKAPTMTKHRNGITPMYIASASETPGDGGTGFVKPNAAARGDGGTGF